MSDLQKLGLVLMVGTAVAPGPAVDLVQRGRLAAALDTLLAAEESGRFDALIVVTNAPLWASQLPSDCIVDLDDTRHPFHYGRRLANVIDYYGLSHVLYFGAGAAPLIGASELASIADRLLASDELVLTNNLHSADWAGFTPAAALADHVDRVLRDNALAWVLHREAGLPAEAMPPSAASRLDIDTPSDLLVLARHPGTGPRLREELTAMHLDTGPLDRALTVLKTEGSHVTVAGRVASSTWAALERNTLCWVRMLAEERGMVASGRQVKNQARSILGAYQQAVGMKQLVATLSDWSDAVFWDNRVLLAHHNIWPSAEDRFASDLGWQERVEEPLLRELTASVAAAPIPIIMGGHALVAGGMLALLDQI